MKSRARRPYDSISKSALLISLLILAVTVAVVAEAFLRVVQAGADASGLAGAIISLMVSLTPLLAYSGKGMQSFLARLPIHPHVAIIGLQFAVLLLILAVREPFLDVLADQQFTRALRTENSIEARQAIEASRVLSSNDTISGRLKDELENALSAPQGEEQDERVAEVASLLKYILNDTSAIAAHVRQRAVVAAANGYRSETNRLVMALIALDETEAVGLANQFNDAGVSELTQSPPNRSMADLYLGIVRMIDVRLPDGRSRQQQSISRLNFGILQEQLGNTDSAVQFYEEAVVQDTANYEAYYALSSILLVYDPLRLDDAVSYANAGLPYVREFCDGAQNLTDDDTFQKTWHCFALLTTVAGARWTRSNVALGDIPSTIEGLVRRAVALAEANDHFQLRPGYYTAEAYYYLAQITQPDDLTLCNIIRFHDTSNPRHRTWVQFANEQLTTHCLPR